jgi:hypothetical protein
MRSELSPLEFVVSHLCARPGPPARELCALGWRKKAQGWGTGLSWVGCGANAGPSTSLRFAQDDGFFVSANERSSSR